MPQKAQKGPRHKEGDTYVVEAEGRERAEAEKDVRKFLKDAGVEVPAGASVRVRRAKKEDAEDV
jgi:hypothetical protein